MPAPRTVVVLALTAVATAVSQSFGRFTYAVLLTDIRADLDLSNTAAGALGSVNLAGYLAGTLVVSYVVGTVGLARVTRLGLAGVTAGLLLLAWSPGVVVVLAGLVATGFSAAGVWITTPALAIAEVGAARRGVAIGIVGAGVGIGILAASLLDSLFDWRHVYAVEGAIGAATLVAAFLVLRATPRIRSARFGLSAIVDVPGWRPLLWAYAAYAAGMAMVVTFTVSLLEEDAGYSAASATLAFSLLGIGSVLGGPVFGTIADRLGLRAALRGAFGLMAVTVAVLATGHRPGATVAALLFGMAFTAVPVTVGARISEYSHGERFGAAYGAATLAFGAGLTVGPQLGGIVADAAGSFRPVFAIAVGCAVVGLLLTTAATAVTTTPSQGGVQADRS